MIYIGWSINLEPLDQTDLNKQQRLDPNGGGKLTFKAETDWWDPQAGWPVSGADRWRASWSLLESSHAVYVVEFYNFL